MNDKHRPMPAHTFAIPPDLAGKTLAAAVKQFAACPWTHARHLIHTRRVRINSTLCTDDTRRIKAEDQLEILEQSTAPPPRPPDVRVVYSDDDLFVVDKPAGIQTLRRSEELD